MCRSGGGLRPGQQGRRRVPHHGVQPWAGATPAFSCVIRRCSPNHAWPAVPELLSDAGGQRVGHRHREGFVLNNSDADHAGTAGQGRRLTRLSAFPILLAGLVLRGGPLLKRVNTDPKTNAGIR